MSDRYPRTAYQTLTEVEHARKALARQAQDEARGVRSEADLRQQVNELRQQPGVLSTALPVISARMSPADRAAAQAKINGFMGFSPTQARDPRMIPVANAIRAGATPVGGIGVPNTAMSSLPAPRIMDPAALQLYRETKARDAAARAPEPIWVPGGDPAAAAFNKRSNTPIIGRDGAAVAEGGGQRPLAPPVVVPEGDYLRDPASEAAARTAAGTGKGVQTPYGTASSTVVPRGTVENPAVVTANGVSRAPVEPWDVALVKRYPAIGVAGSPENKAFVAKYRETSDWAAKDPANRKFDPGAVGHSLADELFAPKPDPVAIAAAKSVQASKQDFLNRRAAPDSAPSGMAALRMQDAKDIPSTPTPTPGVYPGMPAYTGPAPDLSVPIAPNPTISAPNPASPTAGPMDNLPGMPGYKGAPVDTSAPGGPKKTAFNGFQDPDVKAFAQNPEEDQFRKRLREPQQLEYS